MSISILNDIFRTTFIGGKVVVTRGILDLPMETQTKIEKAVKDFTDFTPENDPWCEHDFGILNVDDLSIYWKIDYYDKKCIFGSEDPADSTKTCRVLTILLAEEY